MRVLSPPDYAPPVPGGQRAEAGCSERQQVACRKQLAPLERLKDLRVSPELDPILLVPCWCRPTSARPEVKKARSLSTPEADRSLRAEAGETSIDAGGCELSEEP